MQVSSSGFYFSRKIHGSKKKREKDKQMKYQTHTKKSGTSEQEVLHHLKKIKLPLEFNTPEFKQIQPEAICHEKSL